MNKCVLRNATYILKDQGRESIVSQILLKEG